MAVYVFIYVHTRGLNIGKYPLTPEGNINQCHLGEKIFKVEEKKGEM
jgi:hypothetical protein